MRRYLLLVWIIMSTPLSEAVGATWQQELSTAIPLYGHRNWIVIADSAYPSQSREGIQTIVANTSQIEVLRQVLSALAGSRHVTPIVYTDQEMNFVPEEDAPGIGVYKQQLSGVLGNRQVTVLPHEQIIAKLDQVAQTFRVLIIKTNMKVPYTSVFLQLDCAYWSPDAERRLREAIAANPPATGK